MSTGGGDPCVGDAWEGCLSQSAPAGEFLDYLVYKGSIAIDGTSLTVAEVGEDWFSVWLIPFTLEVTNLSKRKAGEVVNLEFDMLAKYVKELLDKQVRPK